MGALTSARMPREVKVKHLALPLAVGAKAFFGGIACVDFVAGKMVQGQGSDSQLEAIGEFENDIAIDNTAGSAVVQVLVNLDREKVLKYYANDTTTPVQATDVFKICFILDDNTATMNPDGAAALGRVWDVDSVQGVGVEKIANLRPTAPLATVAASVLGAFAAHALAPATLQQDAVYDVPATDGAACSITLPAGDPDGRRVTFCADGTKNAATVQYFDATGAVAITSALTAAKRHVVVCVKEGGKWFANAMVSP